MLGPYYYMKESINIDLTNLKIKLENKNPDQSESKDIYMLIDKLLDNLKESEICNDIINKSGKTFIPTTYPQKVPVKRDIIDLMCSNLTKVKKIWQKKSKNKIVLKVRHSLRKPACKQVCKSWHILDKLYFV